MTTTWALKHSLPIIDTLNEDGTLSAAAEVFVGMDRFAARKKVVNQLRADGLCKKKNSIRPAWVIPSAPMPSSSPASPLNGS
jgi:valyl-tRNA synthetase